MHTRTASITDGTLPAARVAHGRDLVDVDGELDHRHRSYRDVRDRRGNLVRPAP